MLSEAIEHVLQNGACQIHFQFKDYVVPLRFRFQHRTNRCVFIGDLVHNLVVKRLSSGSVRQIIELFCLGYFLRVSEL